MKIENIYSVKNPKFINEKSYSDMKFPDLGYQILSLYRYWNIIQYFYPYKYLIEEDWKDVLEEFLLHFINAQNETEYVLAILELIGRIHDTHANIWSPSVVLDSIKGENYAIPILNFIENRAIVIGFHDEEKGKNTGLKIGDIILEVDGVKIEDLVKGKIKIYPASNYSTKLRDIAADLLRSNGQNINIAYLSDGILKTKNLKTFNQKIIKKKYYQKNKDVAFNILKV